MFVRAKIVKEKQYAYLVENDWAKGKVKQKVKKYLGRILSIEDISQENTFPKIDFSLDKKEYIKQIVATEFFKKGFFLEKNFLLNGEIKISLTTGKITNNKKDVVLFINERYLYKDLLESLLDFFQPEAEEDTKGKKLATAFSDAGISIAPEHFVSLYKKIYLSK